MKYEALIAGGVIVAGIVVAALTLDGTKPRERKKLAGGSEACTYHAGPMDAELIDQGSPAGHRILRDILALEKRCEYVTLVLADGTRHDLKLGAAGRKPGDPRPKSM
ncbi:MAG TPA: hypothetical protein PK857_04565 [Hyphomicrobium sp.]|nr:hypothetical protein [Hyphomicrobium sp.]HRO51132.1 hypothetical protein [Hyphomicrobium sp.]